jgi:hypothetical protein
VLLPMTCALKLPRYRFRPAVKLPAETESK